MLLMKPRHTAALALVGWYLMVPQVINTTGGYLADFNSPLSRWAVNSVFDSASECDPMQTGVVLKGQSDMKKAPIRSMEWAIAQSLTQAQCIATDDPRLAK
jgi:hypothetical protein